MAPQDAFLLNEKHNDLRATVGRKEIHAMRLTVLKRKRLEQGLLQIEVANRTGISRSRLSEIENGHVIARADELSRLDALLGAASPGVACESRP